MSRSVTDQLNRTLTIGDLTGGIVSLVPSQTELLFDLGLGDMVTGVTKFCIHPEQALKQSAVVGGTKKLHFEKIRALHPALILANKEENNKADIDILAAEFPVWVSDVNNLDSALEMITAVGSITGTERAAMMLTDKIRNGFQSLSTFKPVTTLYLIWNEPMMAAGKDTFISDMMRRCGLINVVDSSRYPEITAGSLSPELVLLSSEPFPFTEKHISLFRERFPNAQVLVADGTYFSWYGSRLADAAAYFTSLRETIDRLLKSQSNAVS